MATPVPPPAATAIGEFTVNWPAVELQVTFAKTKPGLVKVTIEVVDAPPKVCTGKVIAVLLVGAEVNGVAVVVPESGKVKVCASVSTPQLSVPVKVPAAALV